MSLLVNYVVTKQVQTLCSYKTNVHLVIYYPIITRLQVLISDWYKNWGNSQSISDKCKMSPNLVIA